MRKSISYKVNLHITDRCIFGCKYCFGKFLHKELDVDHWKLIIDSIVESKLVNAINFSGGEPFLYNGFEEVVEYAYKSGLKLSVISNGLFLLDSNKVSDKLLSRFDVIGISCDSMSSNISRMIGRCSAEGRTVGIGELLKIHKRILSVNPECRLKLNTVVSKFNYMENIAGYVNLLGIDRWKLLRVKPFGDNSSFVPTDEEYSQFVSFNSAIYKDKLVVEEDMANSYIIIDPEGYMLDSSGKEYKRIGNVIEDTFEECFKKFSFNKKLYLMRY